MVRIRALTCAGLAAGAVMAFAAPTAQAAAPVPFTITENIDFNSDEPPTFTATGPLCPSGTFEDDVRVAGGANSPLPKVNLLIRTVYTCADGSGTFFALKHVFITFDGESETSTNTGPITLNGGTGDYSQLRGHGVDNGSTDEFGFGVGEITGVIVRQ